MPRYNLKVVVRCRYKRVAFARHSIRYHTQVGDTVSAPTAAQEWTVRLMANRYIVVSTFCESCIHYGENMIASQYCMTCDRIIVTKQDNYAPRDGGDDNAE